ncbi:MAG: autotransporter domain-containing protein [Devosia sp.]
MTISGGGTASAGRLYLGSEGGVGTGTLTISGSGSQLAVAGNANVGFDDGSGIITLSDGGVLQLAGGLLIAPAAGSTGTLNIGAVAGQTAVAAGHVRGTGGAATAIEFGKFGAGTGKIVFNHTDTDLDFDANVTGTGDIEVFSGTTILSGTNDIGDGAIIVEGGELKITGTTKADDLDVGKNPGSNGTVTISGSGSTLTVADKTYIGRSGNGTLNITNGGEAVFTGGPYLATGAGTTGTITISGAGSKLTSAGLMTVGDIGTGVLAISDGGTATVRNMSVGTFDKTAQGTVTVSGAGSALTVFGATSKLDVGNTGIGTLSISEGGNVAVAASTFVGRDSSGSGTVTIAGNGSKLTSGEDINVGHFGSGTLTITGGGEAAASKNVVLGNFSGSSGTATISGSGSKLTSTDNFFIGDRGAGTLTITGGGVAAASIDVVIGDEASGSGTVTVSGSGSKLTAGEIFTVGNEGAATLTVSDGGAVDAGTFVIIGNSSEGTATVTGSGSKLTAAENLIVGNLDDGTLTILAGGAAEAVNNVNIALNFGSTSTATVSGAGSKLAVGSSFNVGNGGAGTLNVTNGGYVDTGSVLSVGTNSTANGTVTISGARSVVKNGFATYVGKDGQGTLTISNGGELEGADVIFFGFAAGSEGTGAVTGSGSKLSSQAVLIGRQGNGTLTVSNGGVAEVTTGVTIARDAGTSGTLNIGAASGAAAVAAGTIEGTNGAAASIEFGAGTGEIVFNHTDADLDFDTTVSGNGTVSQEAGFTRLTGDFSGFTGTGNISGGTLAVDNTFSGAMNVLSGGTLTGPGNVGTLDFATGSAYEFDFNGNGGLTSTGAVTIAAGSNLAVEFGNSANVSIWQPTTVLTGTSVTGTFDTTNSNDYLFLDIGVSYTATDVVVDVDRNGVTFSSVASTPNQTAVAAAVNGLASGNDVYDAFATLKTEADARNAFNQLSGEAHASTTSALLMGSNTLRSVIDTHMRSPTGQTQAGAVDDMFLAYFPKASKPEGDDLPDWAGILDNDISATPVLDAWGKVYGDFGKVNGNANAAEQTAAGGGALVGLETDNFYGFQAGMLLGYGRSGSQVAGRSSQADINSFTAGAYGSRNFGALRAQVGTTFSYHAIDAERQVAFGAFSDTLTANYGAQTIQGFGELSYAVDLPLATLAPFAGLAIVQSNTDGFTETGGAAALKVDGTTQTSSVSTVGVRINGQVGATGMASKLAYNGTLAWRHQFGAGAPSVTSSFASGGPGFTVAGVPIDQDTLMIEAGLTYSASSTTDLAVAYGGEFGTSTQHHNVNARLSNKF